MIAEIPRQPRSGFARTVAFTLVLVLCWTQWQQAVADVLADRARLGQQTAKQSVARLPLPTVSPAGDVLTLFPGTAQSLQVPTASLFPGAAEGERSHFTDLYGQNAATISAGLSAQDGLTGETSSTGEAYRTLIQSARRSHPDLRDDPVWGATDFVFGHFDLFAKDFADCSATTTLTDGAAATHLPDYRTCVRSPSPPPRCVQTRQLAVSQHAATVSVGTDGYVTNTWVFDLKTGTGRPVKPSDGHRFVQRVDRVDYAAVCQSGAAYRVRLVRTVDWPSAPVPGDYDGSYTAQVLQRPTCENGLVGKVQLHDSGDGYFKYAAKFFFTFERIDSEQWQWSNPNCPDLLHALQDGLCRAPTVQCSADPGVYNASRREKCFVTNGVRVCASDLQPLPYPELSPTCAAITVAADCDLSGGDAPCWFDGAGQRHCPGDTAGTVTGCQDLEAQGCAFIRSDCVDGARGAVSGACYRTHDVYDCGTNPAIPTLTRQTEHRCTGPIRCMGEDCLTVERSQSKDFVRAVAALNAAQQAAMDTHCDAANGYQGGTDTVRTCSVFQGKAQTCKRIGGLITWVDCCKQPTSIGLGAYLDLLTRVSQLDNAITGLDSANALRGAYETLRDPVVNAWTEVTQPFVDVYSDIAADVFGSTSELAKEGLVDGLKSMLMKSVASWVGQTFGAAAGNLLFSSAGSGAAAFDSSGALSSQAASGGVQLGGGGAIIGTALNVIMIVYTIYVIVQILANIIWECEQSEMELAAKKSLRSCVYLGTWCTGHNEWNLCIGEKESYCCFASPLARILQEQIRPQFGMSFGDKKDPDCRGIAIEKLAKVDWNRVNLDEWIAILSQTGRLPTAATAASALNLDKLTGTGSRFNVDGRRLDTLERNRKRLSPLDVPSLRHEGEVQGWGLGPQP